MPKTKPELEQENKDLRHKVKSVEKIYNLFFNVDGEEKPVVSELQEKTLAIQNLHQTIFDKNETGENIPETIHNTQKEIESTLNTAKENLQETRTRFHDLEKEAFGYREYSDYTRLIEIYNEMTQEVEEKYPSYAIIENPSKPAPKDELTEQTPDLIEGWQQKFEKIHTEARGLLPDVASATLASAYTNAKKEYEVKKNYNWAFYTPLILILLINISQFLEIIHTTEIIKNKTEHHLSFGFANSKDHNQIIPRILISLPLAIMSWFAYRNIAIKRRLFEEYHHKQRLMEMYVGFKDELNKFSKTDEKLQKKHIETILTTLSRNPSMTIGKDHTPVESIIDKILFRKHLENRIDDTEKNNPNDDNK